MVKRILVVSDLHTGSIFSLMPPEVNIERNDTKRTNRIESNEIQKVMYQKWEEMIDSVGKVDGCFVLGDCCEGSNYKSRGFELWTPNIHQQVITAADLLGMIKTNKYYGVQGSYYHVGENTSSDLAVIDTLKGTFGSDLAVTIEDLRLHLSHEIGFSQSPVSKATAPHSEIVAATINDKYYGKFNIILRGHRHEYLYLETVHGAIVCAPAWKARDSFAAKKGLKMTGFQCGYFLLTIDGSSFNADPNIFVVHQEDLIREVQL